MIELLLQAERALAMGLVDQAERLYQQAATADPRNSIAVVGLARVALEREDDAEAYRQARRALVIDPENVAAARLAGRLEEVYAMRGEALPGMGDAARRSAGALAPGGCGPFGPGRPDRPNRLPLPRRSPAPEESPVKVLVTGGAGYVGGVSVDAILAAGHEVVVLDDLTTGHASAVNPAARLEVGSYGDEGATRTLLESARHRRDPPLRRPLARGREHRGPREVLPRQRRRWRRPAGGGARGRRAARGVLVHRRGLRRPGRRRRSRRMPRSARSTPTARPSAPSRARYAGTAGPTGSGA